LIGGHPTIPQGIEGAEHGITSDGFFDIVKQPKRVAIVGAGYIAVEFCGMFNALGTETHLYIRGETFLRSFDPMIGETMTKHYEERGVHVHKKSETFKKVTKDEETGVLTLHLKDGSTQEVDTLIWAIGRTPEVEQLKLKDVGVKQNDKGQVIVDDYQNTNVENIYALGDVCGRVELTPGMLTNKTSTA